MKKSLTSCLVIFFIFLGFNTFVNNAFAFSGTGAGTGGDPYIITTCVQLQEMADDLTASYKLDGPLGYIDCSDSTNWNSNAGFTPVGTDTNGQRFSGTLDGNNQIIYDLVILTTPGVGVGLFGSVETTGVIHNVGISGGSISGPERMGALVGINYGTISYSFTNTSVTSAGSFVGGMVGIDHGSITDSYANGDVSGSNYVGGLAGYSNNTITNSFATGDVTGTDSGGLVGRLWFGTLTNVFAMGVVSGTPSGGLSGDNNTGTITNASWDSTLSGQEFCSALEGGGSNSTGCTDVTADSSYFYDLSNEPYISFTDGGSYLQSHVGATPTFTWHDPSFVLPALPGPFSGGTGVEGDPYVITDCEELQHMDSYLDSYFVLDNDIDCSMTNPSDPDWDNAGTWSDGKGFDPIGGVSGPNYNITHTNFTGHFDGQHYKISNLYINRGASNSDVDGYYIGLFATISSGASVSNLGLENVDITGSGNDVGALAGGLSGTVTNVYSAGTVHGFGRVGGLVGTHVDANSFPNSSPLVYTWNGTKYKYTDDVGGILPKSLSGADFAQIDSADLAPKDGKYSMKITEEYNEIVYYDELALMTFDHQPGYSVVEPLDRTAGVNELRTVNDTPTNPLISCTDGKGRNCLDALKAYDDKWGYTNENGLYNKDNLKNSYILDFGDLSNASDIELVLRGARDYGASAEYPGNSGRSIQVKDANGNWVEVYNKNQLGSDGSPRLRTVNLTGKFLTNDYHVKVVFDTFNTNYFAVDTSPQVSFTTNTYHPDSVDLGFHGFTKIDRTHYFNHDYDQVSPEPDGIFKNQYGSFTKYGDVTPLLNAPDDHFVIMHYGDELSAEFPYVPVAPGMERSFMVYNDALYKHATNDKLGVLGQSAGYLPYHGMTKYSLDMTPYPQTEENVDYMNTWNTRVYPGPFPDALRTSSSTIIDSNSSVDVNGGWDVGGLVGDNHKEIRHSFFNGSVTCASGSCGGIAGYSSGAGNINKSYSIGIITGTSSGYGLGGLVGTNEGVISQSYATGNVNDEGDFQNTGGLVGYNAGGPAILTDCYARGSVNDTGLSNVGGLIGLVVSSLITNCYATGVVTSHYGLDGLIGQVSSATVVSSFWDKESSGLTASAGTEVGKTTTEMKNTRTFTKAGTAGLDTPWDFIGTPNNDVGTDDIWVISSDINDGYPIFSWQIAGPTLTEVTPIPAKVKIKDAIYHFTVSETCAEFQATQVSSSKGGDVSLLIDPPAPETDLTARFTGLEGGGTYSVSFNCLDEELNASNSLQIGPFTIESSGSTGGSSAGAIASFLSQEPSTTVTQPITTPGTQHSSNSKSSCVITSTLKFGNKGDEVKCLQTILGQLVVDGIFGSKTKLAVMLFQKNNPPLVSDGVVGPLTRAKIKELGL